ncbi:MAG: hypothetical protein FWH20_06300 [Oscillospiraceae bacterium]|nr:hypothetical protein [Oscillospiraceae bacterium]
MKRLIMLITIAGFAVALAAGLFAGCTEQEEVGGEVEAWEMPEIEEVEAGEFSEVGDPEPEPEVEEDPDPEEVPEIEVDPEPEIEQPPTPAQLPLLQPEDIGMTHDEINALAIQRADELQGLFLDFMRGSTKDLIFADYDGGVMGIYYGSGDEYELLFAIIADDRFKTLDDLFSAFNQVCTPELSEKLIMYSGTQYRDIDGKLAVRINESPGDPYLSIEGSKYISYEIIGDEIILNFTVELFFDPRQEHDTWSEEYSLHLKNINGEWLVSNAHYFDVITHGYHWKSYNYLRYSERIARS